VAKFSCLLTNTWAALAHHYQSRRDLAHRAIPALGLALLLDSLLKSARVYPGEWHTFLVVVVALCGFYHPILGAVAALLVAFWPLWTLSPYLATLFIAITVFLHLVILKRIQWALLVAAAPALAWNLLLALVPLLAGMMLGPAGGFWAGALAAVWLKVLGGMSSLPTDMLALHVQPVLYSQILNRFHEAGSLETLQLLFTPFSADSSRLLLDILQVLGFGLAGAVVGWIRQMNWAENRPWANLTLALFLGAFVAWVSIFLLPIWVGLATWRILSDDPYTTLGLFLSPVIALGLYSLRYLLTRSRRRPAAAGAAAQPAAAPGRASLAPNPPPRKGSAPAASRPGEDPAARDVIKLELD
jgi:hypothetical protein